jgi:hypothetical protein
MIEFVVQHQFWAAVAVYWIFSAAVSAMPEPGTGTNPAYLWLFRFLHTTAGNITTVFGSRIPGLKAVVPLLLVPILLATTACAAHYAVHPGALNPADSAAFDTLLVAEGAINQARAVNQAHPLPSETKDALNRLVQSYNVARESWLTYRDAITANEPSAAYLAQLNKNLTDLSIAIRNLLTARAAASASPIGRSHQ